MRASDAVLSKFAGSMPQALAEVRKIEDPKLRDEVSRRVKDEFQARKQAQDYQKEQVYESSYDKLRLSNGDLDTISPQTWTYMDAAQVERLKDYAQKVKSGEGVKTDPAVYYDLSTRAASPDLRDKFMKENLLNYVNKLAPSDFQEMVKLQTSLRKEDPAELGNISTKAEIMKRTLNGIGIDPTPKEGTDKAKAVGNFQRRFDQEIEALQKRTNKKATSAEMQEIADRLVIEKEVEREGFFSFFDGTTTKRGFEVGVTDKVVPVMVTDVSRLTPSEKDGIAAQLKARNIKVTNENILKVFNKSLAQKGKKK
jgi:soluble lytic murein transglycosylase